MFSVLPSSLDLRYHPPPVPAAPFFWACTSVKHRELHPINFSLRMSFETPHPGREEVYRVLGLLEPGSHYFLRE